MSEEVLDKKPEVKLEAKKEPSLGELFGELAAESSTLVKQEVHLVKAEMEQKLAAAGASVGMVALGGAIANAGLVLFLLGGAYALSSYIPMWASTLFFAVAACALGVWLAQRGLESLSRIHAVPEKTVKSLKANAAWVKEQLP